MDFNSATITVVLEFTISGQLLELCYCSERKCYNTRHKKLQKFLRPVWWSKKGAAQDDAKSTIYEKCELRRQTAAKMFKEFADDLQESPELFDYFLFKI
jgi:hypothetical protein